MAAEYVEHCPSSRTSLRHFADQLPGFLARTEPFCEHGQIPELARFERLLMTAFDAAEANRVANEALAELPVEEWPDTTLRFHPSMQSSVRSGMLWKCGKPYARSENPLRQLSAQTIG